MDRTIRVLHIIKTLGLGGAETNLLNLAQAFDRSRVETHVGYSYGGEVEPRFVEAGVRLFKYADGEHRIKSARSVGIVGRIARYVRHHRIDVVQTHNFNAHVWGLLAAKLAGAKLVEHVHDFRYVPTTELVRRHGLMRQYRFTRYFRHRSDRVVVLTRDNARFVVEHAIARPEQVVELQNGIPLGRRPGAADDTLRTRLGIPADAVVVLTAARMDSSKNIELVLRCAARIVPAHPGVHFVVAGAGPSLDAYRAQSDRLGLARRVHFAGFVDDIEGALAESDVFLLPSFLELHSIAVLEATKMGVPIVVSSGVGCNDEFVTNGRDGFLCDPFDDEPWVTVLTRLLRDPQLRRDVGQRGRQVCRARFDIRRTVARFQALYEELAV